MIKIIIVNYFYSYYRLILKMFIWYLQDTEQYITAMKFRGPKATKSMIKYSNRIKGTVDITNIKIKYLYEEDIRNRTIQSLGSKNKKNIRKNWELAFIAVTIDALYHKFNQYESLNENIMRIPDNTYIRWN